MKKNGDAQRNDSSESHRYQQLHHRSLGHQRSPLDNPMEVVVRLVRDDGKSYHSHDLSCNPSITAAESKQKKNLISPSVDDEA